MGGYPGGQEKGNVPYALERGHFKMPFTFFWRIDILGNSFLKANVEDVIVLGVVFRGSCRSSCSRVLSRVNSLGVDCPG